MERWIAATPWLTWVLAAGIAAVATFFALIYWWLTHPVDDDDASDGDKP